MWKRIGAHMFASYLKTVRSTARLVSEPADVPGFIQSHSPAIFALWHGEHVMGLFARARTHDIRILASRSGDGDVAAIVAERFGFGAIRGSGGPAHKSRKRGGAPAFRSMLRTLQDGASVAMTADVPKIARIVSPGLILLARHSGRPIVPIATAARRKVRLEESWDKFTLGLPFSRIAMVAGEPIFVPPGRDEAVVESVRLRLSAALDAAIMRAYGLVDRRDGERG